MPDLASRIRRLPKVELHVHLEGSIDRDTLLTLADRHGIALPWRAPAQMDALYRYRGFDDFKRALLLGVRCLRRADDFVLAVERLGAALAAQRVRHAEVTVTPQFYAGLFRTPDDWLDALNEGRRRVVSAHGVQLRWIPDVVRSRPQAAMAIARWASSARARDGGVVALGLGGPEPGHPPHGLAEAFRLARERGLPTIPHAGEGTGPQAVRDALALFSPPRIGHGVGAAEDPALMQTLAERGVVLEVCVTSNLRLGLYADAAAHPLKRLVDAGCRVALNTDDPALFETDLGREYLHALADCGLSEAQLARCVLDAVRAARLTDEERLPLLRETAAALQEAFGADAAGTARESPPLVAVAPQPAAPAPSRPALRIPSVRRIEGPSVHGPRPLIIAQIDATATDAATAFQARVRLEHLLRQLRPAQVDERMRELPQLAPLPGLPQPGTLVAHAALELQRWAGMRVAHRASLGTADGRIETIAIEYRLTATARAALQLAVLLVADALADDAPSALTRERAARYIERFVDAPGPAAEFVAAADSRAVPWREALDTGDADVGDPVLEFGHGRRRRRAWRQFTGETSQLATAVSTRKDLANAMFRAHGLPVARQQVVTSAAQALDAARAIGWPVVVKPAATDYGTAVHVDLRNDAEVRAAFEGARRHGPVLVEAQIAGDHHRIMLVDGAVVSARRQKPAHVVGDGRRTVAALVEAANAFREANGWRPIPLDDESRFVLARQGLGSDSVPPDGAEVRLRTQANLSTGGTMELVTDQVHPDNLLLAQRAAAVMDIDVAGLDFITPDISRSHLDVGGAICEINVSPGFILGEPALLLSRWFPDPRDARIPVVVLLDPPAGSALGRRIATLLSGPSAPAAHAAASGIHLGAARVVPGNAASAAGAAIALWEPTASAAVIELHSADVLRDGLRFTQCDLLLVPDEHLVAGAASVSTASPGAAAASGDAPASATGLLRALAGVVRPLPADDDSAGLVPMLREALGLVRLPGESGGSESLSPIRDS